MSIGDVCAPNLFRAVNHYIPQQVGPNLVLGMLSAGVGFLINGHQPHEAHQPSSSDGLQANHCRAMDGGHELGLVAPCRGPFGTTRTTAFP